jgi:hypothetical protein
MVVHTCNPRTQEAEKENFEFKASLGNREALSQKKEKCTELGVPA